MRERAQDDHSGASENIDNMTGEEASALAALNQTLRQLTDTLAALGKAVHELNATLTEEETSDREST